MVKKKEYIIKDFVKFEQESLTKFIAYWKEEAKKAPLNFPEKMGLGEWGEQFRSFQDSVE